MTRQTWTAALSALLFVVLAAVIALVPVPFVTWAPGATYNLLGDVGDQPAIKISGAETYKTTGKLLMTTVSVTSPDSTLSLPEVLISYWMPAREVLPRAAVYRPGASANDVNTQESALMSQSQVTAVVAALRAVDIKVTELPMVTSVVTSGPSAGILQPGDLIQAVDGAAVTDRAQVMAAVKSRHVGQKVAFLIIRDRVRMLKTVATRATSTNPDEPMVGIEVSTGYLYDPDVTFAMDPAVGGSSAGLMFSLAIYEELTPGDLTASRVVAGTGTIDAKGEVGPIGGVDEKVAAASRDGASVFLIPKENCKDVRSVPTGVRLVSVETLADAVGSLQALSDPLTAIDVPGCA